MGSTSVAMHSLYKRRLRQSVRPCIEHQLLGRICQFSKKMRKNRRKPTYEFSSLEGRYTLNSGMRADRSNPPLSNSPMIAITPAEMMKNALRLYLEARYAVHQMEIAAKALGGTDILHITVINTPELWRKPILQLSLPCLKTKICNDSWLRVKSQHSTLSSEQQRLLTRNRLRE